MVIIRSAVYNVHLIQAIHNIITNTSTTLRHAYYRSSYGPILKVGNVVFNDALSTLYLRLYDITDSERGNLLPPLRGLLFLYRRDLCYTSRGTLAGTRNSSMGLP